MQYKELGDTGTKVSAIALGTWAFSGDNTWGPQDETASIKTVHAALDNGINFFDTAPLYGDGRAETILGKALKQKRTEAVIATKVGVDDLAADDLRRSCEESLRLLQKDCIDVYQVHWPSRSISMQETIAALEELKKEGKIRAIGVSNFGVQDTAQWREDGGEMITNQLPYSLLWRSIEYGIQQTCSTSNIGILCYSPLFNGLLTGKFKTADEVPEGRARTRLFSRDRPRARHKEPGCEKELFEAINAIRRISSGLGESMVTVSLAWLLHQKGVISVLAGGRNPEQLSDGVRASDLVLDEAALEALDRATARIKETIGHNPDMWQTESRCR